MAIAGIGETNIFDLRSYFDHGGRAFNFEIFDDRDGVAVLKNVSVRVADDVRGGFLGVAGGFQRFRIPFIRAFGTNPHVTVGVNIFGLALGAAEFVRHGEYFSAAAPLGKVLVFNLCSGLCS